MNRRDFITNTLTATAALVVAGHVPASEPFGAALHDYVYESIEIPRVPSVFKWTLSPCGMLDFNPGEEFTILSGDQDVNVRIIRTNYNPETLSCEVDAVEVMPEVRSPFARDEVIVR